MKLATNIAGGLLGFAFVAFSIMYFFDLMGDQPPPPPGSPAAMFMGAFVPTGYMAFVKTCELLGGILVAVPSTRNIGLLFLGPVILNILAFHGFVMKGAGLFSPPLIIISLIAVFLLWTERKAFGGLTAKNRHS